jgi:BNR repeat-like domain
MRDLVRADCERVTREISRDPYRNADSTHATEVEPDTAANGSTVVAAFQVGRVFDGGAADIGFAVSRDRGRTWKHGLLPALTPFSRPQGAYPRISDPSVAYDAVHRVWLVVSLAFGGQRSALLVSRSRDGAHWSSPAVATVEPNVSGQVVLDKQWITCDNGAASPFRGRCYLSFDDLGTNEIATQFSADGGLTWSVAASGPGFPGRASITGRFAPGVQPVVRPDGSVVIPYFDDARMAAIRSTDGGNTWSAAIPITPADYRNHAGFRAAPLPSAAVDRAGTVYLVWSGCTGRAACTGNDLLLARSVDGVSWSSPVRVPTRAPDAELPGLEATGSGRLALAYYILRGGSLDVAFVSSRDGGRHWTRARRLNSRSFALGWIVPTSQGLMVGDYISASFVGGRAVPVFALAVRPTGGGELRESMFATSLTVS